MLLYHIRATKEIEVFQVLFWISNLRFEALPLQNESNLQNLREFIFLLQIHGEPFMSIVYDARVHLMTPKFNTNV